MPLRELAEAAPPACPPTSDDVRLTRGFSVSMVVSGVRCTLAYVVLPFVVPALGVAPGISPGFGLVIGTVAIAANVWSIRRFWRSSHPWRRPVMVVHAGVIALLVVLATGDLVALSRSAT